MAKKRRRTDAEIRSQLDRTRAQWPGYRESWLKKWEAGEWGVRGDAMQDWRDMLCDGFGEDFPRPSLVVAEEMIRAVGYQVLPGGVAPATERLARERVMQAQSALLAGIETSREACEFFNATLSPVPMSLSAFRAAWRRIGIAWPQQWSRREGRAPKEPPAPAAVARVRLKGADHDGVPMLLVGLKALMDYLACHLDQGWTTPTGLRRDANMPEYVRKVLRQIEEWRDWWDKEVMPAPVDADLARDDRQLLLAGLVPTDERQEVDPVRAGVEGGDPPA